MNLTWSAQDVLRAVQGRSLHAQDWTATGLSIDSRTTQPGDLFFAIIGETLDGHAYVKAAIEAGASAAVVTHLPIGVPESAPLIYVEDTLQALQALGNEGRARTKTTVLAVTGSVGKTTTKEQLRLMLGAVDDTYANEGSLNNHWGVPLSLSRLPQACRFGVFELGMNHAGEMAALTRMVRPNIALITNIEAVHLEFFESTEAIADAKAEIFLGMNEEGIAVLNGDSPHFTRLSSAARRQGIGSILSFGRSSKCNARLLSTRLGKNGTEVEALIMGKSYRFTIGALGEHLALNALGALLACHAANDGDIESCVEALASYRVPARRGTIQTIPLSDGGSFTLIDQTFNASPVATQAAIQVLAQIETVTPCRRIAVLGDMKELGPQGPTLHEDLAAHIIQHKIDRVHCCGPLMAHLYKSLPDLTRGQLAMDSAALAPLVAADIQNGDIVMIKGSKSVHMELVVQALSALAPSSQQKLAS